MTPAARISAAIEVLDDIIQRRRPAADALKDWGLSRRFAGSKDRAAIASLVYDALRRKASSSFAMATETPRALVLGMLASLRRLGVAEIAALCSGENHAPAPLSADETALLASKLGLVPILALLSCNTSAFSCSEHDQCQLAGLMGQCQPNGLCSFPDLGCDSGQRYGEHSGQLSGECVDLPVSGSSGNPMTSGPAQTTEGTSGATNPTSNTGPALDEDTGPVLDDGTGETTSTDATTDDPPPTETTTGPPPAGDPYGPCAADDDCVVAGSTCLMGNGGQAMCAPSCRVPASPSPECPEPVEPSFGVLCQEIGDGTTWCFIRCGMGQACPMGMACSPGNVCSWE